MKIKRFFCLILIASCTYIFAFNPPPHGELLYNFTYPSMLAGEMSTAGGSLFRVHPGYITINPSLPAGEQRVVIDAAYTALIAPSKKIPYGQAFGIGTIIPSRYGVFTGVLQGVFVSFDDMQLKNSFTMRTAYSKDVLDSLYVGIALSGAFGSDWGLNADIGFLYFPEEVRWLSFMDDIRLAASLTGMGKPFNPSVTGIDGTTKNTTGYPSMFTPHFGFAGTLFAVKDVKMGISLDLSFPTFQNMVFDTNIQFLVADIITLSTGWQFNLRETLEDTANFYPSISLSVQFALSASDESLLGRQGLQGSEMIISGAYKPFSNNVHAASAGAAVYLGVTDTDAPDIILWGNDE